MRCPVCGGAEFVVDSPNVLRCTSRAVVDTVPPGHGANLSGAPIPIWGECGAVRSAAQWEAAAAQVDRAAREATEQAERAQADQRRRDELAQGVWQMLSLLKLRGNPGIEPRRVPGRYHLSPAARMFGRVGTDALVDVAPAYRFGSCRWRSSGSHGVDITEELASGITSEGVVVPMDFAASREPVEILYRKRKLMAGYEYDHNEYTPHEVVQRFALTIHPALASVCERHGIGPQQPEGAVS